MPYPSAYLLVFHGSHDPRPQSAVSALADRFAQKIQHVGLPDLAFTQDARVSAPSPVGIVCLECSPLSLHRQIEQFCRSLPVVAIEHVAPSSSHAAHNSSPLEIAAAPKLVVLPLFLLPGVHVMDDIPREIALAQAALGATIAVEMRPAIGTHPKLDRLVAECMAAQPVEAWILLSHGSRRLDGNQTVEAMAERLGALTAYWSVPPNLESRLQTLVDLGIRSVGILPYFLFAGKTTDAIAQTVATLSLQFPTLKLHLAQPLAASSELTDLLVDLAQDGDKRLKAKG